MARARGPIQIRTVATGHTITIPGRQPTTREAKSGRRSRRRTESYPIIGVSTTPIRLGCNPITLIIAGAEGGAEVGTVLPGAGNVVGAIVGALVGTAAAVAEYEGIKHLAHIWQSRGGNMQPDPAAEGSHSTFRVDPTTGRVKKWQDWHPNPQDPSGKQPFKGGKRYDGQGPPDYNKTTGERVPTPHVHDPDAPGGVRPGSPRYRNFPVVTTVGGGGSTHRTDPGWLAESNVQDWYRSNL